MVLPIIAYTDGLRRKGAVSSHLRVAASLEGFLKKKYHGSILCSVSFDSANIVTEFCS